MVCCKDDPNQTSCACKRVAPNSPGSSQEGRHRHTGNSTPTTDDDANLSVPLKRKNHRSNSPNPPVWAISSAEDAPLPAKCDRHEDVRHGVCCKELRGEDERTLIDPDVVRDVWVHFNFYDSVIERSGPSVGLRRSKVGFICGTQLRRCLKLRQTRIVGAHFELQTQFTLRVGRDSDPDIYIDRIIGLSDGLTVPFALTAGLSSIGNSRIVVMGGLAELIAGAISMGVGGFLASQSERDHFRYLRDQTRERVQRSCDGEMEREVHAVLGPLGVDEKLSVSLAGCLRKVEDEMIECPPNGKGTVGGGGGLESAGGLKWSADVGLTAFLLKFGEGLEEVPTRRLYISAATIGAGYFFGGLIPLIPYFFLEQVQTALMYSCIVTGIILLIFGAVKTHFTGATGGWRGYLWGAVSMLAVGGSAAAAAFGIVRALEGAGQ